MAKMTLGKISSTHFTKGMELLLKQKLPVKTAFKIKTLTHRFNDELKKFSELRTSILDQYCSRDEEGKPLVDSQKNLSFEGDAIEKVTKEMSDLINIEIEFESLKIEELGDISLSTDDLMALGEVVE